MTQALRSALAGCELLAAVVAVGLLWARMAAARRRFPAEQSAVEAWRRRGIAGWLGAKGQADARTDRRVGLGNAMRVVELRLVAHDEQAARFEIDVEPSPRRLLCADRHAPRRPQ